MNQDSLYYTRTHEWLALENNVATVGITRFAVDQLTDLVFVELPAVGKKLAAGAPFGVVESVKAVSDLNAPLAGEVIEINDAVVADPALLSKDPYELAWLIRLKLDDPSAVAGLMSRAAYDELCENESH